MSVSARIDSRSSSFLNSHNVRLLLILKDIRLPQHHSSAISHPWHAIAIPGDIVAIHLRPFIAFVYLRCTSFRHTSIASR